MPSFLVNLLCEMVSDAEVRHGGLAEGLLPDVIGPAGVQELSGTENQIHPAEENISTHHPKMYFAISFACCSWDGKIIARALRAGSAPIFSLSSQLRKPAYIFLVSVVDSLVSFLKLGVNL